MNDYRRYMESNKHQYENSYSRIDAYVQLNMQGVETEDVLVIMLDEAIRKIENLEDLLMVLVEKMEANK